MSTLAWVVVSGVAMSAIAMVGSITLVLPEDRFDRLLVPMVALAAGSLLGGAFLLMLPEAIKQLGNTPAVWVGFLGGFTGSSCSSSSCTGITATDRCRTIAPWAT